MLSLTKEIEKAKLSHNVQSMIRHPSNDHFKQIVSQKDLENCPIAVNDVKNAKAMFGPYIPGLKGWSTQTTPKRVSNVSTYS